MPKKGYKQTEEHKMKTRWPIGKKRPPFSDEWKENLSKAHTGLQAKEKHPSWGKKLSEETKKKISQSEKGKVIPLDIRKKMSLSKLGNKNPNWHNGESIKKYPFGWGEEIKDLIRKKDDYICCECGIHQKELSKNLHKKLDVHHIDYDKNNLNPDNLISLCRGCHIKTNYNREYWIKYFNNKDNG